MKITKIQPGEAITIRFNERDRDLIRDHTFADDELTDRLLAAPDGQGWVGAYALDDLDGLLGFIAAESNHCEDDQLRAQLDRLYDKLQHVEQSHEEA